ncbi:MAG TPA: DUF3971 domain-containing protein [Vitreimonas sp.]|nr:DUF3971 domain-containing protein [Vitreimonas sp.]
MIRRSTLIAAEILMGLVAALVIGLGVAWWRLSQGPVELSFLRDQIQTELSRARSGRPVGIDQVELAWTPQAALELRAVGVKVEDGRGGVISTADEARIQLAVLPLLIGHVRVKNADFVGGEISLTLKRNGAMWIAFGPPDAPPDIIVPPANLHETLQQSVNRALDGLEATFRPVGAGGGLRAVSLHNAKLAIVDEAGGGRWSADAASIELARRHNTLTLNADARLEGAQGAAPARIQISTDTRFQSALITFGAHDVRPRAIFSQAGLGPFGTLDAPLTANITLGLSRRTGVDRFEGDVTLGRGNAATATGDFNLAGGRLHGRYDIATDQLIIDQLQLAGERTRVRGEVRVRDFSRILRAAPNEPAAFDIALPTLNLDVPGTFASPVSLSDVHVVGSIVSADRAINFTTVHAKAGDGVVDATGRFYWGEAGPQHHLYPGFALDGTVGGAVSVQQVMAFWPASLGGSVREYVAKGLRAGTVTNGRAHIDIRPSDSLTEALRQDAINVTFDVTNGEFMFVDTMSPIVNARGSGILHGNAFEMTVPEARLNNLALSNGRVVVPRFHPHGEWLTVSAHAEGDARNAMQILMQHPLSLQDRLPIDAASTTGHASVTLQLQRPIVGTPVEFEDWRMRLDGALQNFAGNMTTRQIAVSNGQLQVHGDLRSLVVSGPVRAGGSNVNVSWTEHLTRAPRSSSEYTISGDFDAADLERLGYTIAQYAHGRVGVTVSGQGRGFDVDQANLNLDLSRASVTTPWNYWTKPAGQSVTARLTVARQTDGTLAFNNIDGRGAGFGLQQGMVRIDHAGQIVELNLPRLTIDGSTNARITAARGNDGGLDVAVRGALFDGAPFMSTSNAPAAQAAAGGPAAASPPLRATVLVDNLKLRGGATLSNANVSVSLVRDALTTLIATGQSPTGKNFSLALGPRPADPAGHIAFQSDDAGFAVAALTGTPNLVGGTATADGDWRPGPPSTARFNVRLRDFEVVKLGVMASLLSSVGSLTGLAEMLNGDGIGFTHLEAQLVYANDRVSFTHGQMGGPSLGLTGTGAYDIRADNLDVDGVVAPSPGLNSMLGNLPIVGNLFVSRHGEGVFGMTYSIDGHAAQPHVMVNPVSALTPGILRRIFEPVHRPGSADAPSASASGGAHAAAPQADDDKAADAAPGQQGDASDVLATTAPASAVAP